MSTPEFDLSLCEEAGLYDSMISRVQQFLSTRLTPLSPVLRSLIHTAYKGKVLRLLKSYHMLDRVETVGEVQRILKEEYKLHVRGEIQGICGEVERVVHDQLLTFERDVEAIIYYFKILGDYHRYKAEAGDLAASAASSEYYLKGIDRAAQLPVHNPTRLSLVLNYAVFLHDISKNWKEAIKLAKEAFDAGIKEVDALPAEEYKEVMELLDLLRDSFKSWKDAQRKHPAVQAA